MMRFSEKHLRNESQPPALQAHPSAREFSSSKRCGLAALLVGSAVVCTSLAMAASWDSAQARGSHGARHGGYKAELRPLHRVAHHRPDKIRRLNPSAGHAANKIHDELRPVRRASKVQDELRPIRKVHRRLSGDEIEKRYQRRQRQQDEAEARAEVNRRNLQRQQEAERLRAQAREQYDRTERQNREYFGDGRGGGATSPEPAIRVNPQP